MTRKNKIAAGLTALGLVIPAWCTYDILSTDTTIDESTIEDVQDERKLEQRVERAEEVTRTSAPRRTKPKVKKVVNSKPVKGVGKELFEKAYDVNKGCIPEENYGFVREELGKIKDSQKLALTLGEFWKKYKDINSDCADKGVTFLSHFLRGLDKYKALDAYKNLLQTDNDYFRRVMAISFFQHISNPDNRFTDEEKVSNLADLCQGKTAVFEKPCPIGALDTDEWIACGYSKLDWTKERVCRQALVYSPNKVGTYRDGELIRPKNKFIEELINRGEPIGAALELTNEIGGYTLCENQEAIEDLTAMNSETAKDILCRIKDKDKRTEALNAYAENESLNHLTVPRTLYEKIKNKIKSCL